MRRAKARFARRIAGTFGPSAPAGRHAEGVHSHDGGALALY
jgi:hypothetical protein